MSWDNSGKRIKTNRKKNKGMENMEPEGGSIEEATKAFLARGGKIDKTDIPEDQAEITAKVNYKFPKLY